MHKRLLIIVIVCSVILNLLLVFLLVLNYRQDEISIEKIKTDQYEMKNLSYKYKSEYKAMEFDKLVGGGNEYPKETFLSSKFFPPAIISALISATVTITIFMVSRRIANNQLNFDVAFKHLLPMVYMQLIRELNNNKLKNLDINFSKIENVILENMALIIFTPQKIQKILLELLKVCKSINNAESYNDNEGELISLLSELEKEIIKRFGAFVK
ncbi:hypothetical protein MH111_11060 [Bacillus altitudinis]|uniref:hypothetical protein n=1 Tax=Bacillus altitudinis TaxID=293387 RepID=UPI00227E6A25|nr:hypothetical protein [Bacillus altitudinis]MCY7690985.1 hypothetical protein [Bacillus altitudinis]